jgi:hypothetical protein
MSLFRVANAADAHRMRRRVLIQNVEQEPEIVVVEFPQNRQKVVGFQPIEAAPPSWY